jgi:hypothetical protein
MTLLSVIGGLGLFGALVTFGLGDSAFSKWPWLWGIGFLLAATANWIGGNRLNHTPINPTIGTVRDRLTYRARNKFLSLPMEFWSGPLALLGLAAIVKGLL